MQGKGRELKPTTRRDLADIIERFLDGAGKDPYEWDDFTSIPFKDPELEAVRSEVNEIAWIHQTPARGKWVSERGVAKLRELLQRLRDETKA